MDPYNNQSNYDQFYGGGNNNFANYGTQWDGGSQVGGANNQNPSNSNMPSWLNQNMVGDIGNMVGGFFGHSGSPFQAAGNAINQYSQMGANAINPYNQMGQAAMGNYANWAQQMQNPSQFENNLMKNYQESPNAKYMQQQAMRAGQNAGSAAGTQGSTPLALQMQQNAGNISQQDMQNWMQNALGINQQYGNAEGEMMNTGMMSANSLLGLYGNEANAQGEAAAGESAGNNQDQNNFLSGAIGAVGDYFGV